MKESKTVIENNLKALRLKHGLTQQQAAALLGLQCEDRLSHWERGTATPGLVNVFRLSALYKVSVEELYKINNL